MGGGLALGECGGSIGPMTNAENAIDVIASYEALVTRVYDAASEKSLRTSEGRALPVKSGVKSLAIDGGDFVLSFVRDAGWDVGTTYDDVRVPVSEALSSVSSISRDR